MERRSRLRRFPETDYCFHAGMGEWRGYSSGDERPGFRNFEALRRRSLVESAREHATEMVVFVMMIIPSAWVVTYMAVTAVKLFTQTHP